MLGFTKNHQRIESADKHIVLRQGWNNIQKKFWIQITDRNTDITIRKYMDEEYFQNFHNMGMFTYRQTAKDEVDFNDNVDDKNES